MLKEIIIPDLGEGIETVEVGEVHVKAGDRVGQDDILVVLETEKASMEIPAEEKGTITEVMVKAGDEVGAQTVVARIETVDAESEGKSPGDEGKAVTAKPPQRAGEKLQAAVAPAAAPPQPQSSTRADVSKPISVPPSSGGKVLASPAVRRFARELGADLEAVNGGGPKGRISKDDVQAYIRQRLTSPIPGILHPVPPVIDFSQWGPVNQVELSKIRRASAQNLQAAWQQVPLVTQFDEADITDLEDFRRRKREEVAAAGGKLSVLPFLMIAVARALRKFPDFNASLDGPGKSLIHKEYIHLGIAVDTPNGLVVPVVRDVDQKGLAELAVELVDLSERTRSRKVLPSELLGATFSISSLGGISGTGFTPLVNPPEVAILGVSRNRMQPVWDGSEFTPRLMLPFSLSYDHRVIDGAAGARFTAYLGEQLGDIRNLLL